MKKKVAVQKPSILAVREEIEFERCEMDQAMSFARVLGLIIKNK